MKPTPDDFGIMVWLHPRARRHGSTRDNYFLMMIQIHLATLGFRWIILLCSSSFHILYKQLGPMLKTQRPRTSARKLTSQQDSALATALRC